MSDATRPLAARLRPKTLAEYVGQTHLLGEHGLLRAMIDRGRVDSMLLSGPPGVGKTTLARLLAQMQGAYFQPLAAVSAGVKDIRRIIDEAEQRQESTLVFVDEVHRFNKSQQDAFLPAVEEGTITFLGATTENPGFYVNNALLSRVHVFYLRLLTFEDLGVLLQRALQEDEVLSPLQVTIEPEAKQHLCDVAHGDGRRLLNIVEALSANLKTNAVLSKAMIESQVSHGVLFDQKGDEFYQCISALHKSVRGSDPDASLYWMLRMLEGGCDPTYVIRRLIRIASEDIGNADPRALQICIQASQSYDRLGLPEGELALAQAVLYLAVAPKSNAVYTAYKAAKAHVKASAAYRVPKYLCNAVTKQDKAQGVGKGYQYPHDFPDAFAPGVEYFPVELAGAEYYHPVERGLEQQIAEKVRRLRALS